MAQKKIKDDELEQMRIQARLEAKLEIANDALAAKNLVASDAEASLGVVTKARAEEIKILASAVSEALKLTNPPNPQPSSGTDHDTLVSFGVKIDNMDSKFTEKFVEIRSDIKEIKDGTAKRIDTLELLKLDIKDSYPVLYRAGVEDRLAEHGRQIDSLEGDRKWIIGAFSVASIVATLIIYIYFSDIGRLRSDLQKYEETTNAAIQNLSK